MQPDCSGLLREERSGIVQSDQTQLHLLDSGSYAEKDRFRPELEYRHGHIPTALSIPLSVLEQRLYELPRHREVAGYCRGPCCVFADQAAQLLRRHGLQVRRLWEFCSYC
jgi:hypothetical protein